MESHDVVLAVGCQAPVRVGVTNSPLLLALFDQLKDDELYLDLIERLLCNSDSLDP